jgi:TfoX/Sxy family transcriptional regulator of competence genes
MMAYSEALEAKIEDIITSWPDMDKKLMFGGVGYLIRGNMCFGIHKDYLIVRMDKDLAQKKIEEDKSVRSFDITGRPMKGWVMVAEEVWSRDKRLDEWLEIGRRFALTLPAK